LSLTFLYASLLCEGARFFDEDERDQTVSAVAKQRFDFGLDLAEGARIEPGKVSQGALANRSFLPQSATQPLKAELGRRREALANRLLFVCVV
jgi:hypothetical protein